jgi:hypothetical protein
MEQASTLSCQLLNPGMTQFGELPVRPHSELHLVTNPTDESMEFNDDIQSRAYTAAEQESLDPTFTRCLSWTLNVARSTAQPVLPSFDDFVAGVPASGQRQVVNVTCASAQPVIPSFRDFVARIPPPRQRQAVLDDEESQYSQHDGGMNGPTGRFVWAVCSSHLSVDDVDKERPIEQGPTGLMWDVCSSRLTEEAEDAQVGAIPLVWNVTESVLTVSEPETPGLLLRKPVSNKRDSAWLEGPPQKRFCSNTREKLLMQQPVTNHLAKLFPEHDIPSLEETQAFWDSWQPQAEDPSHQQSSMDFDSLPDYEDLMQQEVFLPEMEEAKPDISPATQWLVDNIMLRPHLFSPKYKEPSDLALTPTNDAEWIELYEAGLVQPAKLMSARPTPPWRKRCVDAMQEQTFCNSLPMPSAGIFQRLEGYRAQAELRTQAEAAPTPMQNHSFCRQSSLAERRQQSVERLNLFFTAKDPYGPMIVPHTFAVHVAV